MRIAGWAPQDLYDNEAIEVARDRAEGVRLAYVAATRARDVLVVPAIGDGAWEGGWLAPLDRALYPPPGARREAEAAPGCPAFKSKDSVLERPEGEPADAGNVAPGQHLFPDQGGYSVVWWDPRALKLDVRPNYGLRREDLIVKDVPKHVVADGRARYDRWRSARNDARERGSIPTVRTLTVHEWVETATGPIQPAIEDAAARVSIVDLAKANGASRTGGASFGVLVHQLLGDAPFGASRAMLDDMAIAAGRTIGLSDADAAEAAAIAARVLEHDLLVRARASEAHGACRRETPVTFQMADGLIVEGVVDLAFEEGGAWTVIDYKTDREPITEESGYRRQVALYAAAIARATGQPASAVILRV